MCLYSSYQPIVLTSCGVSTFVVKNIWHFLFFHISDYSKYALVFFHASVLVSGMSWLMCPVRLCLEYLS